MLELLSGSEGAIPGIIAGCSIKLTFRGASAVSDLDQNLLCWRLLGCIQEHLEYFDRIHLGNHTATAKFIPSSTRISYSIALKLLFETTLNFPRYLRSYRDRRGGS